MSNQVNYTISPINSNNTILQILKKIELYLQEHPIPTDVVTEEYVQTMINTLCIKKTDVDSALSETSENPIQNKALFSKFRDVNGQINNLILTCVGIIRDKADKTQVISSLGGKTGAVTLGNGLSIDNDNVLSASGSSGDNWQLAWSGSVAYTSSVTISNVPDTYKKIKIVADIGYTSSSSDGVLYSQEFEGILHLNGQLFTSQLVRLYSTNMYAIISLIVNYKYSVNPNNIWISGTNRIYLNFSNNTTTVLSSSSEPYVWIKEVYVQ